VETFISLYLPEVEEKNVTTSLRYTIGWYSFRRRAKFHWHNNTLEITVTKYKDIVSILSKDSVQFSLLLLISMHCWMFINTCKAHINNISKAHRKALLW